MQGCPKIIASCLMTFATFICIFMAHANNDNYSTVVCYLQVKRADGRLVAKAIDVDLSQFRSALLLAMDHDREAGVGCSSDRDCTFFRCLGECDVTTGVCSGKLKSSNLVVCRWYLHGISLLSVKQHFYARVLFMRVKRQSLKIFYFTIATLQC
jgi:hypothetical protein